MIKFFNTKNSKLTKEDNSSLYFDKFNPKSLFDVYNDLLKKYNIDIEDHSYYNEGYSFFERKDAENYINNNLSLSIKNIEYELEIYLNENLNTINNFLYLIEGEIDVCESMLDETKEYNYLYQLNLQISKIENLEEELGSQVFPERKLNRSLNNTFEEFDKNIKQILKINNKDEEVLSLSLMQRELFKSTKQQFTSFRKFADSLRYKIHSFYYPPKPLFFKILYFLSFILLISEIGFSMSIVRNIMNTGFGFAWETLLSVFYSMGISLAMAIGFKNLIEDLLFKTKLKVFLFWLIFVLVFFILLVLFSYKSSELMLSGKFYNFTNKALILSFFSSFFALANAFIFREASYLHHLFDRVNKYGSLESLNNEKQVFNNKITSKLAGLKRELERGKRIQLSYKDTMSQLSNIKTILSNLENICLSSFWKGFEQKLIDIISSNQDILVKIKRDLEKQNKLNI